MPEKAIRESATARKTRRSATLPHCEWTRRELASHSRKTLHRGGWANPDVFLVEAAECEPVVWKDFAPRPIWLRVLFGVWITRREVRAYRVLEGLPWVPRLLGAPDRFCLVLEYRPGRHLSRSLAGKLPAGFLDELRIAVTRMHELGVFHLDLRHRSNVLASDDGHPVLIDLASAVVLDPKGLVVRLLGPLLAWIDRRALRKWEVRLGISEAESDGVE